MTVELSNDDRGKTLVSRNKRLGVVTDVTDEHVYLDLDFDNVPEKLQEQMGWDPADETHRIDPAKIGETRNDEVTIRDDIWPR